MEHPRTTKNVGQPCVICGQPANAQATVEALHAVIRQMGEQAAVLAKDGMTAKAQVAALQRVRDEFERERDQLHAALMEAKAALDAEREKVKAIEKVLDIDSGKTTVEKVVDLKRSFAQVWESYQDAANEMFKAQAQLSQLQALVRAKEDAYEKILLSRERLEREMRGYPPVDNEGIPMVWQEPVGWVKHALDATTPAPQTDEQRFIAACCGRPDDCKWGGTGGCGYEGRQPKGGGGE